MDLEKPEKSCRLRIRVSDRDLFPAFRVQLGVRPIELDYDAEIGGLLTENNPVRLHVVGEIG